MAMRAFCLRKVLCPAEERTAHTHTLTHIHTHTHTHTCTHAHTHTHTHTTEVFQKLFRQDLLVASLFRNFLLAERIMRSYNCTPECHPCIPPTYHHPMWQAWDLALDHIMGQLPALLEGKATYEVR